GPGQARVAARYETIEAAARRYLESTANAAGVVNQALDAISQGGDEPTKRLVLHNTLAQHAKPALGAQESLAAAIRRVMPAENVELAALVQNVSGLTQQVAAHRARLEQTL